MRALHVCILSCAQLFETPWTTAMLLEWFSLLATRNGRAYLELTIPNNVIMVQPKPKPNEKTVFPKEAVPRPRAKDPCWSAPRR